MHSILTALKQKQTAKICQQELNPQTIGRLQAQYSNFEEASPFETYVYPQQQAEVPQEHYEQLYESAIKDIQSRYHSYLLEEQMNNLKMEVYLLDQNIAIEHHKIQELNSTIESTLQTKKIVTLPSTEDKFEQFIKEIRMTNEKMMEPKLKEPKLMEPKTETVRPPKTLRFTTALNIMLPGVKLKVREQKGKEQAPYVAKLHQEIEFTKRYLSELKLSLTTNPHLKQEIKRGKTALKTLMTQFWIEVSRPNPHSII